MTKKHVKILMMIFDLKMLHDIAWKENNARKRKGKKIRASSFPKTSVNFDENQKLWGNCCRNFVCEYKNNSVLSIRISLAAILSDLLILQFYSLLFWDRNLYPFSKLPKHATKAFYAVRCLKTLIFTFDTSNSYLAKLLYQTVCVQLFCLM